MDTRAISPLAIVQVLLALAFMYFLMRGLFKGSILFKIGLSTASVLIFASLISSTQAKLGPIHSLWSFPLQIGLVFIAYYYINVSIKKPLQKVIEVIREISKGNLQANFQKEHLKQKDEVGNISLSMVELQNGLKEKTEFAKKIGEGQFDDSFQKLSESDELGEALLNMQKSLKEAKEQDVIRKQEDAKRNWITEGQAKFAEILRQSEGDVSEFSYRIISNMVTYMGINQGGLFILNDDDTQDAYLELTACYAFDRRKYLEKRIEPGEGLVGTCFLEGEIIYLRAIPQDYIRITSGLGDENPSELLIVPLKLNDQIFGVMELASFGKFEKHHIEFAEKIGEIIASSISGLRISNRTSMLLEKSQQQAEEMRAQEEEMRQNMEELSATQEAMAEKERENLETIQRITQENEKLKADLENAMQELHTLRNVSPEPEE